MDNNFDKLQDLVIKCFSAQKALAEEAERLYAESDEYEKQGAVERAKVRENRANDLVTVLDQYEAEITKNLIEMQKLSPSKYQQFIESFADSEEEECQ